jgi:hypothetical protein
MFSWAFISTIAETLIDKAIELNSIGGVYGNQRPTHFLCLLLKLLQIQPEKEILLEYLQAEDFKYAEVVFDVVLLLMMLQIFASISCVIHPDDIPGS